MDRNEYLLKVKREIVQIATKMLSGDCGIVEGSRMLSQLGAEIDITMDKEFLIFRSVDSNTDDVPCGDMRNKWDKNALKSLDVSLAEYLNKIKPQIESACRYLIDKYQ